MTERLVADGWQVMAISRQPETAEPLAPHMFEADVSDPFAVQRAVTAIGQEVNEVDLVVYAAGDITSEPVGQIAPETWRRILERQGDRLICGGVGRHAGLEIAGDLGQILDG